MNIKNFTPLRFLGIFAFLLSANMLTAQSQTPLDIALRHIENNYKSWELTQQDVNDLAVSSSHISTVSGAAHIYFNQQHQGIGIHNAITNVAVSDEGEVIFAGNNFTANIAEKVNTTTATLSAEDALTAVLSQLNKSVSSSLSVKEKSDRSITFEKGSFSKHDVKVSLSYFKSEDDRLILSYGFYLDPSNDMKAWQFHVDATNGTIIDQTNMVIECKQTDLSHRHSSSCSAIASTKKETIGVKKALANTNTTVLNSYRVFEFPSESPIHGDHVLAVNPEDLNASPLGWHDTGNNQYTITRGNNGHAMLDRDGNGAPDIPEPDGGADLDFDFPYDLATDEPTDVPDAAVTNLFYAGNFLHDWSYSYGFTEAAGAFQVNNFGNGGVGNDPVNMYAQSNADNGSINNASMGTPPDGLNPSMNMFVWDQNDATGFITVEAPASIAGNYATGTADYGPAVTTTPICGEVVIVNDNVNNPTSTDGCEEEFVNGAELDGKIALVDRGGCFFQDKTSHAEAYGAIALIICNFEDPAQGMAGGGTTDEPTIPTLMLSNSDCQTIRQFAGGDLELCFVQPTQSGPTLLDADFDNGIIAHEYAHGISNRLVGGANNTSCIPNTAGSEYMGEGWSDWVALVTTMKPGDTGDMTRGIGNFSVRLEPDGRGIRN
ncbi:MAG: M36 family metallopeptidase, partial [Saprospiraceae bacterium]